MIFRCVLGTNSSLMFASDLSVIRTNVISQCFLNIITSSSTSPAALTSAALLLLNLIID